MAGDAVAQRGTRTLDADEYQHLLERLFRLENVGVLLGAGASVPMGGRVLGALWESLKGTDQSVLGWLAHENFVPQDAINTGRAPNLEALLDALGTAEIEWKRQAHPKLDELRKALATLRRSVLGAGVLNVAWWEQGVDPDGSPQLDDHRRLLLRCLASRQPGQAAPWVFTLNYDLAVEWAAETIGVHLVNGFSGLHRRAFSPHHFDLGLRSVVARGEAQFGAYHFYLAKLHGSLSWLSQGEKDVLEEPAPLVWRRLKPFLVSGAAVDWPGEVVLPAVVKYERTVGFVMGELSRRFSEFLARPQTLLIIVGYSFGDAHINRFLASGLQNPTLQVVVYRPDLAWSPDRKAIQVETASDFVRRLQSLELAQVTFKPGGKAAHFDQLVRDLPEPALSEMDASAWRRLASLAASATATKPVGTASGADSGASSASGTAKQE